MSALADLVALSFAPPRLGRLIADRLHAGEAPAVILATLPTGQSGTARSASELRADAAAALARARAAQIVPIDRGSPEYPAALLTIADPPPVLWTRGAPAFLHQPCVAIVGSRTATPYGISVAERLAADLAGAGFVIVSGFARGVDGAAHHGALAGGGATIAVLGCGVDVIYPPEHRSLAGDVAAHGAIVGELAPGTAPLHWHFPRRNRIISGLSRAVVVIEAGERSGSLITARLALEQGREVLAVPGNVLTGRNRGAHSLLRDGAKIVEGADDILEELGYARNGRPAGASKGVADPLLTCLSAGEAVDLDEISERSGLPATRLLPRLFELELAGLVRRAGGGRFVLV